MSQRGFTLLEALVRPSELSKRLVQGFVRQQVSVRRVSTAPLRGVPSVEGRLGPDAFTQLVRRQFGDGGRPYSKIRQSPTRFGPTRRSFHWGRPRRSQTGSTGQAEPQSLSARLKKLSREYGWSAVGIYFSLSVLDFPFCFLLVKAVGTDKIAAAEHFVVSNVAKVIPENIKQTWRDYRQALKQAEKEKLGNNEISQDVEAVGWGVKEAEQKHEEEASLVTQLALAYAIHKSFIFVRVPLTVAVTPRVVKVLRSWGWRIGKKAA